MSNRVPLRDKDKRIVVYASPRSHIIDIVSTGFWIIIILLFTIAITVYTSLSATIIWGIVAIIISVMILSLGYHILYVRLFRIEIDPLVIEFRRGVTTRIIESLDMYKVTDFINKRGLWDQLLGLSNIQITSSDQSTPLLNFRGLDFHDAARITEFLQLYSSDSIVKQYINKKDFDVKEAMNLKQMSPRPDISILSSQRQTRTNPNMPSSVAKQPQRRFEP